jgi:RNA polymerase primary sigma factor
MTALMMKRAMSRKRTATLGASRGERRERQRYAALVARVREVLQREIDFIGNRKFSHRTAEQRIMTASDAYAEADERSFSTLPKDLPAHLARLCETQVLTADEERELFRRMNFLKYRANVLRSRLNPDDPDEQAVEHVERLMAGAGKVRDRIIKANMRLVISIVKKFVTPKHSFDELLSDGIVSLMHAVDKFDYDKGFRFSTYAYRAVARNAYRTITDQHRRDSRFDSGASDDLMNIPEQDRTSPLGEQQWVRMRKLMQNLLDRLDRREQFILRSRFALGAHRKVRTFQCLADKLGVSKERVRQLEQRAIAKLQALAATADVDN